VAMVGFPMVAAYYELLRPGHLGDVASQAFFATRRFDGDARGLVVRTDEQKEGGSVEHHHPQIGEKQTTSVRQPRA